MSNLLRNQAEAYSRESFLCGSCGKDFETSVITWVDVSKTPLARQALLKWQFNIIQCTHCGCRNFSGSPFFYEDFEEGLLIAVFPRIPNKRGSVEQAIKEKFGYYPVLEFFYDMTQIWMLLYFQEHYRKNKNLRVLSRLGRGEERIRRILKFLKEDPLMIDIREKLTESFFDPDANEALMEILGRSVYTLEEMLPWPADRKCLCGADLSQEIICCGDRINLADHEQLLSKHYVIYCPTCKESITGAACARCGSVYTWKLGVIPSFDSPTNPEPHRTASSVVRAAGFDDGAI
jgi:hypothetical protein